MDRRLIEDELERREYRASSSGFIRLNCPYCVDRVGKEDTGQCLSVSAATGWFGCWRCGAKGKIRTPEYLISGWYDVAPLSYEPKVMPEPDGFIPLWKDPGASAVSTRAAREYLTDKRHVPEEIWGDLQLGCCLDGRFADRVIVPVISPKGVWIGWVGRSIRCKSRVSRTYMNAPGMALGGVGALYNQSALAVQTDKPVLVVEGVFDAISLWPDAVAVLGKPTEDQVATLIGSVRPVVIVLDGDSWAEAEMLSLKLRMYSVRAGFVRLPPCKDPDEVNHAWLWEQAAHSL